MREDQYLKNSLNKLRVFKKLYSLHVFLIAHPKTINEQLNGVIRVPTLYDISGGSQFFNAMDAGIVIHRDADNVTHVHIKKVRERHLGKMGVIPFRFDFMTNRYYEIDSPEEGQHSNPIMALTMPEDYELPSKRDVFAAAREAQEIEFEDLPYEDV